MTGRSRSLRCAVHTRLGVAKGGAAAYRRPLDTIAELRSITVGGDGDAIAATVAALVARVTIDRERIVVWLRAESLAERLGLASPDLSDDPDDRTIDLTAPIEMRRRGVEMRFVIPGELDRQSARIEPALVKAVARGQR